ncbi:MAG: DUF2891 domain-containing protein [Polaribacter sp.]|nr:DUF2891 domain-containing protein [Polaribacter sp.]
MKNFFIIFSLFLLIACNNKEFKPKSKVTNQNTSIQLNSDQAQSLIGLPMHCIDAEFPNKLGQTIGGKEDLQSPRELHPSFYGCFDWHSSVHGHWALVSLLKQFPKLENVNEVKKKLLEHISRENISKEVEYFLGKHNKSYERTYGWAWLLKLAEELHTWDDDTARKLEKNLQPLTDLIVQKYLEFIPKLNYPIRVGEHPNTAFGLTFAWDYAKTVNNELFLNMIKSSAEKFYLNDTNCPISWEPGGFDFLSPCLQEAAIMKRILTKQSFKKWFSNFLPQLKDVNFKLDVGEVSDRTDGKLVHLDGVNFSRAWALFDIVRDLPDYSHLKKTAFEHINYSLPNVVGDSYEGGHWLGSFAIYALNSASK